VLEVRRDAARGERAVEMVGDWIISGDLVLGATLGERGVSVKGDMGLTSKDGFREE